MLKGEMHIIVLYESSLELNPGMLTYHRRDRKRSAGWSPL